MSGKRQETAPDWGILRLGPARSPPAGAAGAASLLTGRRRNAMKTGAGRGNQSRGYGMLAGWIVLIGLLLFAYAMGYATREIISRRRRRLAEEFRRMRPRRSEAEVKV